MKSICCFFLAVIFIGLSCAFSLPADAGRTWSDASGTYQVEADLVGYKDFTTILLRRSDDGETIEIPISMLSESDKTYLEQMSISQPTRDMLSAAEIEKRANRQLTAKATVQVLRDVMASGLVKPEDAAAVQSVYELWVEKEQQDFVRVGPEWMPLSEAEVLEEEAIEKFTEGIRLLSINSYESAVDSLEEASRINPDAIYADSLLGILYAIEARNIEKAKRHFSECSDRRNETNAPSDSVFMLNAGIAQNNMAITDLRKDNDASALNHWVKAVEWAPQMTGVLHNVGQFYRLANRGEVIILSGGNLRRAERLYTDLATHQSAGLAHLDSSQGWLYLCPLEEPSFSERINGRLILNEPTETPEPQGQDVLYGSGTAFAIAPNHLITNRHVVENGDRFEIVLPSGVKQSVVLEAVSQEHDLAILQCERLNFEGLKCCETPPALGIEVAAIGYPRGISTGQQQDVVFTTGVISAMPSTATNDCVLFDLTVNRGSSGGPVCDRSGRVIAIATFFTSFDGGNMSGGVCARDVAEFALENGVSFGMRSTPAGANLRNEWSEVVETSRGSVFPVLIYQDVSQLGASGQLAETLQQEVVIGLRTISFEDSACMACNGSGYDACGTCTNGSIRYSYQFQVGIEPALGIPIYRNRTATRTCGVCNGEARVECTVCDGRGH